MNNIKEKLDDFHTFSNSNSNTTNNEVDKSTPTIELNSIKLPNKLKEIFIEDWHKINIQNIMYAFPQSPNIVEIIDKYIESKKFMHSKFKSNKSLMFGSLLTPSFPKTNENSDYFRFEFQWLYINDILSKFKSFAEQAYTNVFYTKEEEQYVINYITTNNNSNMSVNANVKNAIGGLGVTYIIRILILYSSMYNGLNTNSTEIAFFNSVISDFLNYLDKLKFNKL